MQWKRELINLGLREAAGLLRKEPRAFVRIARAVLDEHAEQVVLRNAPKIADAIKNLTLVNDVAERAVVQQLRNALSFLGPGDASVVGGSVDCHFVLGPLMEGEERLLDLEYRVHHLTVLQVDGPERHPVQAFLASIDAGSRQEEFVRWAIHRLVGSPAGQHPPELASPAAQRAVDAFLALAPPTPADARALVCTALDLDAATGDRFLDALRRSRYWRSVRSA